MTVGACVPAGSGGSFLGTTLAFFDCQAQSLGEGGYRAFTTPGSTGAALVTAALTIFVAVFGYRLLLGDRIGIRDGVVAAVKVGVVVMLAASWPAFQTLIYDTTLRGPAELAATISAPSGLPGSTGGLVEQLQALDYGLAEFSHLGAGRPYDPDRQVGPTIPLNAAQQQQEMQRLAQLSDRPRWDPQHDATLIDNGRAIFLASTIGAFAALRLLAGLLIALAPIFLLFLLFDTTRGIFEGWVRGLGGTIVAAAAASVVLGVELALVGPWLVGVVAARRAGVATPAAPIELVAMALVFAVVLAAVLITAAKVAYGFRLPVRLAPATGRGSAPAIWQREQQMARSAAAAQARNERGRADQVAEAVTTLQRREATSVPLPATRLAEALGGGRDDRYGSDMPGAASTFASPPARTPRRRTGARLSAGSARRDRAS